MIETIISGLVLAIVSGFAFLAYRHPTGYRMIVTFVALICSLPTIGYAAFHLGMLRTGIRILGEDATRTQGDMIEVYKSSVESLNANLTTLTWVLGVTAAATLYLAFLWFLPRIIGRAIPQGQGKGEGSQQESECDK